MLLGHPQDREFSASEAAEAAARVERLAFVGLTECAVESIALFCARFNTTASEDAADLVRASTVEHSGAELGECEDTPDRAVYSAAVARFRREYSDAVVGGHAMPRVSPSCGAVLEK